MKKDIIITICIFVFVLTAIVWFLLLNPSSPVDSREANGFYSIESQRNNHIFEIYFGTDITISEAQSLLSEIKNNNEKAPTSERVYPIGVCFILKDDKESNPSINLEEKGIYTNRIDSNDIKRDSFNDINFSADLEAIELMKSKLKQESIYKINVPTTKSWKLNKKENTGFEKDGNPLGLPQTASTGSYYSNDYIRLIYIIEN